MFGLGLGLEYGYGYGYNRNDTNTGNFHCDGPNCSRKQRGARGGKPGNGWNSIEFDGKQHDYCTRQDCQDAYRREKEKIDRIMALQTKQRAVVQPQPQPAVPRFQQAQQVPHAPASSGFAAWQASPEGQQALQELYRKYHASKSRSVPLSPSQVPHVGVDSDTLSAEEAAFAENF